MTTNFVLVVVLLSPLVVVILIVLQRTRQSGKSRLYPCPSCQFAYKPGTRWCPSCHRLLPLVHFAFQQKARKPIYARASRGTVPIILSPHLAQDTSSSLSDATTQRALPILYPSRHAGCGTARPDLAATLPAPHLLSQEADRAVSKPEVCPRCQTTVEAKMRFCGCCGQRLLRSS